MDEQKPGRRIVSKAKYVRQVAGRNILALGAVGFGAASIVLLTFGGIALFGVLIAPKNTPNDDNLRRAMYVAGFQIYASLASMVVARLAGWRAVKVQVDIPITHVDTANLPAQETLVRASAEPVEQQQTVLLRAASQSDTTPAEQMVRPARE